MGIKSCLWKYLQKYELIIILSQKMEAQVIPFSVRSKGRQLWDRKEDVLQRVKTRQKRRLLQGAGTGIVSAFWGTICAKISISTTAPPGIRDIAGTELGFQAGMPQTQTNEYTFPAQVLRDPGVRLKNWVPPILVNIHQKHFLLEPWDWDQVIFLFVLIYLLLSSWSCALRIALELSA